jgi:hypothetical protein
MLHIPLALKTRYGAFLRTIVSHLQQCLGTIISQEGRDCFRHAGDAGDAQAALKLMAPSFPMFIDKEDEEWINVGHDAMMKALMVPLQLRHYYVDTPKRVIFIGLYDDELSFHWLDGTVDYWIKVPETLYWKPSNGKRTSWNSGPGEGQKAV